ncbi:hypothetical protein BD779DRAFT_259373 [Infundibulicybe gibba]|nr:hypothetical protein BD779DRAFT_259373 [Infundibulicybe gibba]
MQLTTSHSHSGPRDSFISLIKSAVLLAVLSASAASAIKVVFYGGSDCRRGRVGQRTDHKRNHSYPMPQGVLSVSVSENPKNDTIRVFSAGRCWSGADIPEPRFAIDTTTRDCAYTKLGLDQELRCYTISETT